jgi:hypothetical protein
MNIVIIPLENVSSTIIGIHEEFISFVMVGISVIEVASSVIAIFIGLGFLRNINAAIILTVVISLFSFDLQDHFFLRMFLFCVFLFIVGALSIFLYYYSYMIVLLSLELVMLSLVCFFVFCVFFSYLFFPVLFFLLVFVCMGAYGLSLLVFFSRSFGFDYLVSGYFYGLVD